MAGSSAARMKEVDAVRKITFVVPVVLLQSVVLETSRSNPQVVLER